MAALAAAPRQLSALAAQRGRPGCVSGPQVFAVRWKQWGKNRSQMERRRALEQHVDYFRQLKGPKPYRQVEVDPKLQRPWEEVRQVFNHPEVTKQPQEDPYEYLDDRPLKNFDLDKLLSERAPELLRRAEVKGFGQVEVLHGDLFQEMEGFQKGGAVIIPMTANLVPYRGLGLEFFERSGPDLVRQTFDAAKAEFERREELAKKGGYRVNDTDVQNGDSRALQAGDTIVIKTPLEAKRPACSKLGLVCDAARIKEFVRKPDDFVKNPTAEQEAATAELRAFHEAKVAALRAVGLGPEADDEAVRRVLAKEVENDSRGSALSELRRHYQGRNVIFVVMPWFWQGSPLDAAKRFRHCVKQALAAASANGFSSVTLPNLGSGIFGYEPRDSSRILVEEAFEALLQIEAESPKYCLKSIRFTDSRLETAEHLQEALNEVSHRWLPEWRLTTAAQYWGSATKRLLVLPAVSNFFWRRERVKFKKTHSVRRKARRDYIGNVRSRLWRAHKVHQPPPLLVRAGDGEAAPQDKQLKARPYYFRGVSHWLFPVRRSGIQQMRKSSKGQWIGRIQQYRLREDVRPRL